MGGVAMMAPRGVRCCFGYLALSSGVWLRFLRVCWIGEGWGVCGAGIGRGNRHGSDSSSESKSELN